jgi:GNAT superfamily N-acetyltransferase
VHPHAQRKGIGLKLMAMLEKELAAMGAKAMFGNIGAYNLPSFAFFSAQGWKVVLAVKRRRAAWRAGGYKKPVQVSPRKIAELVHRMPVLASREAVAYFKRAYFSINDAYLEQAIAGKAIRIPQEGGAYALLDFVAGRSIKNLWVTALAGSQGGMQRLLEDLLAEARGSGAELVVDGPDEPALQAAMDDLGFRPPGKMDVYSVVRKELTPAREAG